MKCKNPK